MNAAYFVAALTVHRPTELAIAVEPAEYWIQFVPILFTRMKQIQEKEDSDVKDREREKGWENP